MDSSALVSLLTLDCSAVQMPLTKVAAHHPAYTAAMAARNRADAAKHAAKGTVGIAKNVATGTVDVARNVAKGTVGIARDAVHAVNTGFAPNTSVLPTNATPTQSMLHGLGQSTVTKGVATGAALGGLKGLLAPGEEYDENGRPHRRNRFLEAAKGMTLGGMAGGLAAPLVRRGAGMALNGGVGAVPAVAHTPVTQEVSAAPAPAVAHTPVTQEVSAAPAPAVAHTPVTPAASAAPAQAATSTPLHNLDFHVQGLERAKKLQDLQSRISGG